MPHGFQMRNRKGNYAVSKVFKFNQAFDVRVEEECAQVFSDFWGEELKAYENVKLHESEMSTAMSVDIAISWMAWVRKSKPNRQTATLPELEAQLTSAVEDLFEELPAKQRPLVCCRVGLFY